MNTGASSRPALPSLYRSFNWSNPRVWSLELPVDEVPLAELEWHLRIPIWSTVQGKRLFDLVPIDVMEHPREYIWHYRRILDTSVRYPIDTILWDGTCVILDGVHRLARLWLSRAETVRVRRVPPGLSSFIQSDEDVDD